MTSTSIYGAPEKERQHHHHQCEIPNIDMVLLKSVMSCGICVSQLKYRVK